MSGLFGKKGQAQVDQRLNAIQINQSAYGNPMPLVYGKTRIPSNLGWYGSFVATPHTQKLGGGKGGGGGNSTTSFTYSAALILMLCEGPGIGIGTVWSDKEQKALSDLGLTLFAGAGGQAVWSYLTTNFPAQAIPYDHTAYVATASFDLGGSAGLPNLTFEVKALKPYNAGTIDDAEITDIIIDYLGDANHGAQFSYLGTIQGAGATTLQTYCIANGFFISPAETTQRSAVEFLRELLTIANAEANWSAGVLNIVPYGNESMTGNSKTYTPVLTPIYGFGDDDYCPDDGADPIVVTRKAASQTFNRVRVEYLDRANQYNVAIAEATDANDIALNGERAMPTITLHSITTLAVARLVAQLILQRQLYTRNTFEFKVRADYSLLEPMDLVAVNESTLGIVNQLVRILETTDDEEDGFSIVAEEVPVGPAAAPAYNWQAAAGYAANYFASPGSISTPLIFALPPLLVDVNGGYELAIAASGAGGAWGGCDVYMSLDNTTYLYMGTISGPARYGTLRSTFASGADPDDANTLQLQLANTTLALTSGTQADEDNLRTLMYVDGEIMSYRTATLVGAGQYDLTHMRRGKYGSTIASHSSATKWARIDAALFRVGFDPGMNGQTVYFKFPSFNVYGKAHETLAAATAYSYLIQNVNAGQLVSDSLGWTPVLVNTAKSGAAFTKVGGSPAWDAAFSSKESFPACFVAATVVNASDHTMVGLNSDPTTDASYSSIDHALYHNATTDYEIYENGSGIASSLAGLTPAAGDQLRVTYDGQLVEYFINGARVWVTPRFGAKLFADSSLYESGSTLTGVSFGPLGNQRAVLDELRDDFQYVTAADFHRKWIDEFGGSTDLSFLTGLSDSAAGTALRSGNNSGNDELVKSLAQLMAYDGVSLYEAGIVVRRNSGSGLLYFGLEGVAADGVTLINTVGANSVLAQHYIGAAGVAPGAGWTTYRGFARGWNSTTGAGNNNDSSAPAKMYTGVAFVRPQFFTNYNGVAGQMDIAAVWTRRLGGALNAKNTANTAEIDPNAATDYYGQTTFGSTVVSVGSPSDDTVSVTVAVNSVIQVVCRANSQTGAGGTWQCICGGTLDGVTVIGTQTFPVINASFSVSPGTYAVGSRFSSSSGSPSITDRRTEITVVKR